MKRPALRALGLLLPIALAATAFAGSSAVAAGARCKAFKPAGDGKGKPVTLVTSKATAKKPVKVTLDTGPGMGFSDAAGAGSDQGATSHSYTNLQVDSTKKTAKLFVRAEFQYPEDYDLFLRYDDGTAAAYAAGFNEAPVPDGGTIGLDGTGHGGHAEMGAEQIDGARVKDCDGYTVDLSSATTPGGTLTLKYWLK